MGTKAAAGGGLLQQQQRGRTRSSDAAFRFAQRFLADAQEQQHEQQQKCRERDSDACGNVGHGSSSGAERGGHSTACTAGASVAAGSCHGTHATTETEARSSDKSSSLQVMSHTDYGKYERLSKQLDEEEARAAKAKDEAAAATRAMMQGCSHDHSKERQIYEKPTHEKIDAADRFRQEGNAAFRAKNYGLAAVNYRKALLQFDYTFPETPEEQARMDSVKLPCHLNLAACKLHQQDYEEVYIECRLALEMDPENVKARYRRGLAYLHQDHFEEAKTDLMEAHARDPRSKEIRDALQLLREKIKRYRMRSAKAYRAMLHQDGSKEESNSSSGEQQKDESAGVREEQQQQQQEKGGGGAGGGCGKEDAVLPLTEGQKASWAQSAEEAGADGTRAAAGAAVVPVRTARWTAGSPAAAAEAEGPSFEEKTERGDGAEPARRNTAASPQVAATSAAAAVKQELLLLDGAGEEGRRGTAGFTDKLGSSGSSSGLDSSHHHRSGENSNNSSSSSRSSTSSTVASGAGHSSSKEEGKGGGGEAETTEKDEKLATSSCRKAAGAAAADVPPGRDATEPGLSRGATCSSTATAATAEGRQPAEPTKEEGDAGARAQVTNQQAHGVRQQQQKLQQQKQLQQQQHQAGQQQQQPGQLQQRPEQQQQQPGQQQQQQPEQQQQQPGQHQQPGQQRQRPYQQQQQPDQQQQQQRHKEQHQRKETEQQRRRERGSVCGSAAEVESGCVVIAERGGSSSMAGGVNRSAADAQREVLKPRTGGSPDAAAGAASGVGTTADADASTGNAVAPGATVASRNLGVAPDAAATPGAAGVATSASSGSGAPAVAAGAASAAASGRAVAAGATPGAAAGGAAAAVSTNNGVGGGGLGDMTLDASDAGETGRGQQQQQQGASTSQLTKALWQPDRGKRNSSSRTGDAAASSSLNFLLVLVVGLAGCAVGLLVGWGTSSGFPGDGGVGTYWSEIASSHSSSNRIREAQQQQWNRRAEATGNSAGEPGEDIATARSDGLHNGAGTGEERGGGATARGGSAKRPEEEEDEESTLRLVMKCGVAAAYFCTAAFIVLVLLLLFSEPQPRAARAALAARRNYGAGQADCSSSSRSSGGTGGGGREEGEEKRETTEEGDLPRPEAKTGGTSPRKKRQPQHHRKGSSYRAAARAYHCKAATGVPAENSA